jgi:glycerol-3-phosphate dehydrogenase
VFPERLVVAMLEDARQLAAFGGLEFRVFNYHKAWLENKTVEIRSIGPDGATDEPCVFEPSAIVNATGAWVDETLQSLHVPSERLIGGTKGTHAFTFSPRLRDALAGQGIYAEARDGRPIFITPLANSVLIGTTDDPFEGRPERALATEPELDYLLSSVNAILPDVHLTRDDVDFHYCAVRPLPFVHADQPAAITRRHALIKNDRASVAMFSVVGGKLTTMRSLAETATETVLETLRRPHSANSRDRVFPGGEGYPTDLQAAWSQIAERVGFPVATVAAV